MMCSVVTNSAFGCCRRERNLQVGAIGVQAIFLEDHVWLWGVSAWNFTRWIGDVEIFLSTAWIRLERLLPTTELLFFLRVSAIFFL